MQKHYDKVPTQGSTNPVKSDGLHQQLAAIGLNLGDLSDLTTTDQTSAVAAINEVNSKVSPYFSQLYLDVANNAIMGYLSLPAGNYAIVTNYSGIALKISVSPYDTVAPTIKDVPSEFVLENDTNLVLQSFAGGANKDIDVKIYLTDSVAYEYVKMAYSEERESVRNDEEKRVIDTKTNLLADYKINLLEGLTPTSGYIYSRGKGDVEANQNGLIYQEIPVKAGVTLYYKNIYAYFSGVRANDGRWVVLSDDSSNNLSGSFTPDFDGFARITLNSYHPNPSLLTTDETLYQGESVDSSAKIKENVEIPQVTEVARAVEAVGSEVSQLDQKVGGLVPLSYDAASLLTWVDGTIYNNNGISTDAAFKRTLPFDLKKGESIQFVGGKGNSTLIINALARYNNGRISNLVEYTEESGQSVEYTATEDIQVIVSSSKTAFGGTVTIETTNDIVSNVELCKSSIGPKKFEYTDNSTINPFIEKIELNGTFDNKRLGFYRPSEGNRFNIQIRQGSTIVALSANQSGELLKDGISKVQLNEYNNSGVSGYIWCNTSKLLAITTLSSIIAQESISGAWVLPSLRSQMDMVLDTFFGATRFPAVIWEDGMCYNGAGISTSTSYQKATLILRKGETIKFHGGKGDAAVAYINAVSKKKVNNSVSLLVAYTSDDEDITYTATEDMRVIVSSAKASFGGTLTIIEPSFVKEIKGNVRGVVVDKTGIGDYTSLSKAIIEMGEIPGAEIYVNDGDYDIIQELTDYYGSTFFDNFAQDDLHRGLYLRNRIRVVFSTNAIVKCNYTGENTDVMRWLSAFNAGANGFELINADIQCSNIRYCVHDERGGYYDAYRNVYKNCRMYLDNSGNTGWQSKQCIGGGCGLSGDIVIEDCYFESVGATSPIVSYHNSATADAKSNIVIRGCYFAEVSTCSIQWYGTTTKMTRLMASNNSLGAAIIHRAENSSATTQNTELIEWNNVIRS